METHRVDYVVDDFDTIFKRLLGFFGRWIRALIESQFETESYKERMIPMSTFVPLFTGIILQSTSSYTISSTSFLDMLEFHGQEIVNVIL